MESEIEEKDVVATLGDNEDVKVGIGAYLVRLIPNLLKVKFSYLEIKRQCRRCFAYHRDRCERSVEQSLRLTNQRSHPL